MRMAGAGHVRTYTYTHLAEYRMRCSASAEYEYGLANWMWYMYSVYSRIYVEKGRNYHAIIIQQLRIEAFGRRGNKGLVSKLIMFAHSEQI